MGQVDMGSGSGPGGGGPTRLGDGPLTGSTVFQITQASRRVDNVGVRLGRLNMEVWLPSAAQMNFLAYLGEHEEAKGCAWSPHGGCDMHDGQPCEASHGPCLVHRVVTVRQPDSTVVHARGGLGRRRRRLVALRDAQQQLVAV